MYHVSYQHYVPKILKWPRIMGTLQRLFMLMHECKTLQSRRIMDRKIILHRGSLRRGICYQTSTAVLEGLGVYSMKRGSQEKNLLSKADAWHN